MFCKNCGKKAVQNAIFCDYCGFEFFENEKLHHLLTKNLLTEPEIKSSQLIVIARYTIGSSKDIHNLHPWRRFFARAVDLMSLGVLTFLLFILLITYLFSNQYINIIEQLKNPLLSPSILYLLWFPIEAFFISFIGTTAGKWLFGIQITDQKGEKLSYKQAIKRSFLVFFQGEGFALPFIALLTKFFAYRRLTKTGTTLWDSSVGSVITHKKWSRARTVLNIAITLILSTMLVLIQINI